MERLVEQENLVVMEVALEVNGVAEGVQRDGQGEKMLGCVVYGGCGKRRKERRLGLGLGLGD